MLTLILVMMAVFANADSDNGSAAPNGAVRKAQAELQSGMVVNQTVTVAGQDFYRYFMFAWQERDAKGQYAISIHERPSARWGTQVWVEFAQRRIFLASLPTARAGIKALSEQAAEASYQKVADAEVERLLFRDADVGPDEI